MDRINGADTTDIGGGRRGFRNENLVTGIAGTEVTDLWLNTVQEEILKVITEAGLVPSEGDWTQLWQALQIYGLASDSRSRRWLSVNSMTLANAPGAPSAGDAYLIPTGATGIWASNVGKIAQWTGSVWTYLTPPDGHGISLPDGRVFERVAGTYVEKLALDAQSGKWNYAVAGGTANALTATLTPAPTALVPGMVLDVGILAENTGAATLDVNGLGAAPIKTMAGAALQRGDLILGSIMRFVYSGTAWLLGGGLARSEVPIIPSTDITLYVRTDGNDINDGGANTAARAFKTIQRAIDFVTTRYSTSATYGVKIVLGNAGTYAAAINNRFPGALAIEGGGGAYIITGGDIAIGGPGAFASRIGRVTLKNLNLRNTAASGFSVSVACLGGYVFLDNVSVTSLLNNPDYSPIYIVENGVLSMSTSFVLNGGDNTQRQMRALIQVATGGVFGGTPSSMTMFLATSAWVAGMVEAQMTGVAIFGNITINASGAFAGPRYSVYSNGVINTFGGGANFFPGSSAGTTATGGQYL
jgi:hypothetical protein